MADMFSTGLNKLRPSQVAEAIRTMRHTGISLYVHGSPGISKSAVALQAANEAGMAFIDFRLTQMAPEDVRGVPMPGEVDHMKGIIWIPPMVFPRDLNYEGVETLSLDDMKVIRFFNPKGNNDIHYCTAPQIEASSLISGVEVSVTRRLDSFTIRLCNVARELVEPVQVHWKVTGQTRAILALEEFNSAPPSVMAAAYQLILDRRIGDYIVPKGVSILAMGNRDNDRGVTFQLPKPVANRFVHVEMEFSWDDFFEWAASHNIHPDVLGFLSKWQSKTNDFHPESPALSFATPRSWEFVSKIISVNPAPSNDTLRALIAGAIGDAIGTEFIQHRKFMADMPNIASILDGSVTKFSAKREYEMQIAYSVCVQICHELRNRADAIKRDYRGSAADFNKFPPRRQWLQDADRGFAYIIDNFRPEVAIMAARLSATVHKLQFSPTLMTRFGEFCDEYQPILTA